MAYIGNTPAEAYISISSQTFTTINGTGYVLSSSVTNPEDIALFLNNVRQKPSTYTATGTALTMGTATTTADALYCVYLGKGIQTVTPGLASVGTAQIADLAVTTAKLDNLGVTNAKVADDAIGVDELSATGTASSSTYLRGDNAWSSIAADTNDKVSVSADDTTPGYLNGKLVGGTNITLTEGSGGGDETLTAALTGTIATARLGTGTADATTFLRGDQTYAAPVGGSLIKIATADYSTGVSSFTLTDCFTSGYSIYKVYLYNLLAASDGAELRIDLLDSGASAVGNFQNVGSGPYIEYASSGNGDYLYASDGDGYIKMTTNELQSEAEKVSTLEMTIYQPYESSHTVVDWNYIINADNDYLYNQDGFSYLSSTTSIRSLKFYTDTGTNFSAYKSVIFGVKTS